MEESQGQAIAAAMDSAAAEPVQVPVLRESDNAVVNTLMFTAASIRYAPDIARGIWRDGGRARIEAVLERLGRSRPHPLAFLALALSIFCAADFMQSHTIATGILLNGRYVGAVENAGVYQSARNFVRLSASDALGEEFHFEGESIMAFPVIAANDTLIGEEALVQKICDGNSTVTYAYALKINGERAGVAYSESAIEDALKEKLAQYRRESTISAEFDQPIEVTKEIVSMEEQRTLPPISTVVDTASQEEIIYTVKSGDTWSEIAEQFDMSSKELLTLNPGFDMDKIWVDQELTVSAAVPLLSVKTVDRITYQESIAYETEWVDDASMYRGETRVIRQGVNGAANMEAYVGYKDGIEVSRDVMSSSVLQAPVNRVMARGTKERPKTAASGSFAWPASGRLSSTFGGRRSPGGIGSRNHKGIDIAGSRGQAIRASDGGTVSYAGWMRGFGYLVIINHGNGYETYYAHNSKLNVSVGSKVYKGQQIAQMGSTGNSTGNHCHFEIRLHGTPLNPLNFL